MAELPSLAWFTDIAETALGAAIKSTTHSFLLSFISEENCSNLVMLHFKRNKQAQYVRRFYENFVKGKENNLIMSSDSFVSVKVRLDVKT